MSNSLEKAGGANRAATVDALVNAIDAEVKDQSGLSGTAVKAAYAAVQKAKPNVVTNATNAMLDDFLAALAPLWDAKPAGTGFGAYLASNGDRAAEALLAVTDGQTADAKPALAKAYNSLRGKAKDYVIAALPRVGDAIEQNAT
ncbi:DUF6918 family protein [Gordonia sp. (in: high G+C Gram-positive bacteria)]|uniref:DUF6918 family protein n=1 Tax=Gordonia sp. (in: high G+C Gram-positive bacteria) TaxID=84139 RepID=UPI0039E42B6A